MTVNPFLAKTLVAAIITALLAITFANTAEARRFGGGKSFGDQGQNFQRSAPNRQQAAPQRQDNTPAQNRPASAGMGGMLAGLAAGGLLAWMFFGGAFEGLQAADFLFMLLLGVGAFLLFRHLRQRQQGSQPQPVMAGAGGNAPQQSREAMEEAAPNRAMGLGQPRPGSLMDEFTSGGPGGGYRPPSWFDEERFLNAARTHFTNLQLAWDANRMDEIREFVSADLFRDLIRERAGLGDAENITEVVTLDVSLEALGEDGPDLVAAVRFTGQLREQADAEPTALNETWIIRRNLDDQDANWLIAGIRQND